jgi:FlaG/FlaF family flagellin (archaellin)
MKQQNEWAVSPVVGVMLMLVVVIIIAAVVSGFAGSLVSGNNQEVPKLTMDVDIANSGFWSTSFFKARVTGVDSPIHTSRLKIITSWTAKDNNGAPIKGGATMLPYVNNYHILGRTYHMAAWDNWTWPCPLGYGTGVGNGTHIVEGFYGVSQVEGSSVPSQNGVTMDKVMNGIGGAYNFTWFGNYKLQPGTTMFARPFGGLFGGQQSGTMSMSVGYGVQANASQGETGGGRYNYAYGPYGLTENKANAGQWEAGAFVQHADFQPYPASVDQMQAMLGNNWNMLRAGDTVNIKVIDIPSGKTIFNKDVIVTGAA